MRVYHACNTAAFGSDRSCERVSVKAAHNLEVSMLGVSITVDDNAIVCLIDKVRAAADVIQVWRIPPPALQGYQFMAHRVCWLTL